MAGAAVTASAAVVRGRVTDTEGEPLPGASLTLLSLPDSAMVTGASANDSGRFMLTKLKKGKYVVKADYIGYTSEQQPITLKSDADTLNLKPFKLAESSIVLKEAVAIGVVTPVKVMEDTIQYNASAYKTPPNAVVEDLLKRLPGVEVDKSGSITAQGQKVTKILVDGEEFFGSDPTVASKNLPVDMVENAQVINRKSDLARLTGVDDGEDETVINLTVKKGMKNGWTGTVEAGYGTDEHWRGRIFLNGMTGKNTFSVFGNFNNVNEPGFGDMTGGRFRNFGGSGGLTTTEAGGFNFTLASNPKLRFGGNVSFSHTDRDSRTTNHRINTLQGISNSIEDSKSRARDKSDNFRSNFRLLWEPDSFNTLEFRPEFSYFINNTDKSTTSENMLGNDRTAQSRNIDASKGHGYDLSGRLIYSHKFNRRRGRSFSISANYSMSDTREDESAWSRNAFWALDSLYEDYQEIKSHSWNNGVNSRVSWSEPLGDVKRGNFIEVSYMMNYRWNNADKDVWHQPWTESPIPDEIGADWQEKVWHDWALADRLTGLDRDQMTLDSLNSNHFRNDFFSQSIRIGYRKVSSKYNLNAGIGFNPSSSKSVNLSNHDKDISRHVWNYAPFVRFTYRFDKQSTLNLFYNGRSSQPSLTQLQPVADTSDPMNIIVGNPALDPSFSHNLRGRAQFFNPDKQQSIMVMVNGSLTQNAVASNVTYNVLTGGRETHYENVDGNWEASAFTIYSRPLRNKAFSVNNFLRASYRQQVGFSDGLKNFARTTGLTESFGFSFKPDDLELELRPRYTLSSTVNTIRRTQNHTTHTYGASIYGTWYTKFGLVLSTDLDYSNSKGYSIGYDPEQWMWNASISYMFLRDKNATIALKGYDLLQQRKSISRSETAQAIIDTSSNTLTRYFMLTFTYKFNTFKKKGGETPEMNNDFMRGGHPGMGGPGMGGGRPGGGRPF